MEFDEFLTIMAKRMLTVDGPKEVALAFEVFDTDRTGAISVSEIRKLLTTCGDVSSLPLSRPSFIRA